MAPFIKRLIVSLLLHVLLIAGLLHTGHRAAISEFAGRRAIIVQLQPLGALSQPGPRRNRAKLRDPGPKAAALSPVSVPVENRTPDPEESRLPEIDAGIDRTEKTGNSDLAPGVQGLHQESGPPTGSLSPEQWTFISASIERARNYPRLARERGIEGTVHLRFRLKPRGEIETVEIVRSSGYHILDDASIRTLYRAAPLPYVEGWIEVPIAYVLK